MTKQSTTQQKKSVPAQTREPERPKFNFGKWSRPMNHDLARINVQYRRHLSALTIYDGRAQSARIAGLSTDGDEAATLLAEADRFDALAKAEAQAALQVETDMWTLIGRTIVSVPQDWLMEADDLPDTLDFTAAETYDKWLRINKLPQLLPLFVEARDSKN